MKETMEVREFIKRDIDVDVVDDVCESLCIGFVGPQGLTEAGERHFEDALDRRPWLESQAQSGEGVIRQRCRVLPGERLQALVRG